MRGRRRRLIVRNWLAAGVGAPRHQGQYHLRQGLHAGQIAAIDRPSPMSVPTTTPFDFRRSAHLNRCAWDQSP